MSEQKYIGRVIDNADPDQMGRIKLRIPHIHDEVPDDDLPWAIPQSQSTGKGALQVPSIGDNVHTVFQGGDVHEPLYLGNVVSSDNLHDDFKQNYPNRKGFVTERGDVMWHDVSTGDVHYQSPSGLQVDLASNGEMTVVSGQSVTINVGGVSMVIDGSGINLTGGDIVADGISLKQHVHGGVIPGGGTTGLPQ